MDTTLPSANQKLSQTIGLAVVAIGASVLIGWIADIAVLKRLSPTFVAMSPLTALLFIVAGCAIALLRRSPITARILGGILTLLGVLKLLQFAFHGGWGICDFVF